MFVYPNKPPIFVLSEGDSNSEDGPQGSAVIAQVLGVVGFLFFDIVEVADKWMV